MGTMEKSDVDWRDVDATVKGERIIENTKSLATAAFHLAKEFYPNLDEKSKKRCKELAGRIEGLAKYYGNCRVARERRKAGRDGKG